MKPVEDAWDEFDDMDYYDDVERLPCTLKYLVVCISLPLLNGFINGFAGSAQALYFRDMNWPLWHLGISLAVGFCLRLFSQYIQVQLGIWTALPMSMLHLIGAVLAIGFTTEEWAICVEIVCLCGFDSSSAIEGIAFDAFSESDDFARQATSTALAIFTVSIALACTLGGIIYDSSGWVGMSIFHGSGQGLLLLILLIYPTCRQSFRDFFYLSPMEKDVEDPQERLNPVVPVPVEVADVDDEKKEGIQEHSEKGLRGGSIHSFAEDAEPEPESSTINMPETKEPEAAESEQTHQPQARESGGVRWQLEDVDEDTKVAAIHEEEAPAIPKEETPGEKEGLKYEEVQEGDLEPNEDEEVLTPTSDMNQFRIHKGRKRILSIILPERSERRQSMAADLQNRQSQGSGKSRKSGVSGRDSRVSRRSARVSRTSRATRLTVGSSHTAGTQRTHKTLGSGQTGLSARTGRTGMTAGTMRSQLTSLAETGANFEHHFMVNSSLGPRIVTRVGEFDQKMDEVPEEPEPIEDVPLPVPQGKLSADLRIPMLLISFCVVCNSYCYSNEFGSFAILLREYYGVSSATMCALGQTGGDFLAAIVMQVAALSSEVPCLDAVARCWARIAFPPYNLCWVLLIWIGLNMMMISSMLPLAICGQVMMSSSYCLASKWAAELCHFYSMDDDLLFMNMQIRIGQAQSLAAALSSFLATLLFEQVHPTTSYIVSGSLAGVVLLIYTAGFCGRVGCQHAHLAEEEREA